ncbi:hypothetical protein [Methylobacterium sp. J-076]|uniref:hypothetical protein n=1 Tax=Methylobacterium sp. J-076 TaxID=2836655 RepID=UPI001FBAFC0F|nr:hypothetical protein [Methylobacterium sp. J-076]MCJ2013129.1 hypothetical protein [Methylobacterium sp. J-076]
MDAAAHRVRPVDLARLATLRGRREEEARRVVRARAAAREEAEARTADAVREVAAREAAREAGERDFHARLEEAAPVGLTVLVEGRLRIAGLTEEVAAARTAVEAREAEAETAQNALARARARHAARMGETRRWDRVRARILSARRAASERAEESVAEDETSDRLGAAKVRA